MSHRDCLHKLVSHLATIPRKKNALCYIWLEASKSVLAIFYYLGPSNLPLAVVEKLPLLGSTASCALNLYQGGIFSNHFQLCEGLGPDTWPPIILSIMTAFYFPANLSHPGCCNIVFVAHKIPNLTMTDVLRMKPISLNLEFIVFVCTDG